MKNILLIFFLALVSCKEAPKEIKVLDVPEFLVVMNDVEIQLIDVRTHSEFTEGYITGATNIDIYSNDFETEILKLDKNKPIAVYCKKGGRSNQAAEFLLENNFQTIYDLKGGVTNWKAQKFELTQ